MRHLVKTSDGESSFTLEREEPLEQDEQFWHPSPKTGMSRLYIARVIEPGDEGFDNVVKADLGGTMGPGEAR